MWTVNKVANVRDTKSFCDELFGEDVLEEIGVGTVDAFVICKWATNFARRAARKVAEDSSDSSYSSVNITFCSLSKLLRNVPLV